MRDWLFSLLLLVFVTAPLAGEPAAARPEAFAEARRIAEDIVLVFGREDFTRASSFSERKDLAVQHTAVRRELPAAYVHEQLQLFAKSVVNDRRAAPYDLALANFLTNQGANLGGDLRDAVALVLERKEPGAVDREKKQRLWRMYLLQAVWGEEHSRVKLDQNSALELAQKICREVGSPAEQLDVAMRLARLHSFPLPLEGFSDIKRMYGILAARNEWRAIEKQLIEQDAPAIDLVVANGWLGFLAAQTGMFEESASLLGEMLRERKTQISAPTRAEAEWRNLLAYVYHQGRAHEDALAAAKAAYEIWEKVCGKDKHILLPPLKQVAEMYAAAGKPHEAERLYRDWLHQHDAGFTLLPEMKIRVLFARAKCLETIGRGAEAAVLRGQGETLATQRALPGLPVPGDFLAQMNEKSILTIAAELEKDGRLAEAEKLRRADLDAHRQGFGNEFAKIWPRTARLACVLAQQGKLAEAEQAFQPILEQGRQKAGITDGSLLTEILRYASSLDQGGNRKAAISFLEKILQSMTQDERQSLSAESMRGLLKLLNSPGP